MLFLSRVAGRTLGLRGPDLARGPEVARPCVRLYYRDRLLLLCLVAVSQMLGTSALGGTIRIYIYILL